MLRVCRRHDVDMVVRMLKRDGASGGGLPIWWWLGCIQPMGYVPF